MEPTMQSIYDNISVLDFRYRDEEVVAYLSENARTKYLLMVEGALVHVLTQEGICSESAADEIVDALHQVTTEEVYEEEGRIRHDIRALVNCIQAKVSDNAKRFVHLTATSYDIIDTANALRFRDVTQKVVLPNLRLLIQALIALVKTHADTVQIGRTHGQHAEPITFGFALAEYVHRLSESALAVKEVSKELRGKFAGAVGAHNAMSLLIEDPLQFEARVLGQLGLAPALYSTQIVPPERLNRLLYEIISLGGIIANLADDIRQLARPEIREVMEPFGKQQVGSSTMPHKRNPIISEGDKALWKVMMPRIITVLLDQVSEHQRDLTNSASGRTFGEIIDYLVIMTKRMTKVAKGLIVFPENMRHNLEMTQQMTPAEPLYIILAAQGHPDAHEAVRRLTLRAETEKRPLGELVLEDAELAPYLASIPDVQRAIIGGDAAQYTGLAGEKALGIVAHWEEAVKFL